MRTNAISDMLRVEGKPNKKSKEGGAKGSVAIMLESIQLGCVSEDSFPRKSVPREPGKLGTKGAVTFSKGTRHQIKIRERKGPSQCIIQSVRLMSVAFARKSSRRDHMRRP